MADATDDLWFIGSLILANTSELWWVSLCWLGVASFIALGKLFSILRSK